MRCSRIRVAGLIVAACVVGVIAWSGTAAFLHARDEGQWHKIAQTNETFARLQVLCDLAATLTKENLTVDLGRSLRLSDVRAKRYYSVDVQSGHVVDAWGNPIELRPPRDDGMATFMSCGPNGKDDAEGGDDIIVQSMVDYATVARLWEALNEPE